MFYRANSCWTDILSQKQTLSTGLPRCTQSDKFSHFDSMSNCVVAGGSTGAKADIIEDIGVKLMNTSIVHVYRDPFRY